MTTFSVLLVGLVNKKNRIDDDLLLLQLLLLLLMWQMQFSIELVENAISSLPFQLGK